MAELPWVFYRRRDKELERGGVGRYLQEF